MDAKTRADLIASSPLAWLLLNETKTENQKILEFTDHRFLIDLYTDMSPDIVVRKSAQVGESVERILKTFWCNKYLKANVIYVLPTNNVVKDFVAPKVNPLITSNPHIQNLISKDSESLKQIGDRFTYFKGAFSERDAISISGDILVLDELDRMPSMQVVNTFDSRLQASSMGWRWRLSNPSQIGFGVDGYFQDSDQMHWFIKCSKCNHEWFIDFATSDENNHYVNIQEQFYACGKCHKELSDSDRRNGRWIAKYPTVSRRGYWINQLMAPWVTAKRILEQKDESSVEFFHNYVLGKAYTPTDMDVDRAAILRANAPSNIPKQNVSIGVDQDAGGQYFVAMTPQGVFAHGYVDSWEKIEHLKLMYNAIVVSDPNPYPTMPKQMQKKYSDWYLCYFKNIDGLSALQWKNKNVYADRTRIIDIVANEIVNAKVLFREHAHALEDIIGHWGNLYRTTEEKEDGRIKSVWIKKDQKQSDYPFAMVYARIGLSRIMGANSDFIDPYDEPMGTTTPLTVKDNIITADFRDILNETWEKMNE